MSNPFGRGAKPHLTSTNEVGAENGAITLDIAGTALFAGDTLSYTITGLPAGFNLSAGTLAADGSWTLTSAQIIGVQLTPPTGYVGTLNLAVAVVETAPGGYQATNASNFSVQVNPVAFTPNLSVSNAQGDPRVAIPLSISASQVHTYLVNGDLTINVSGLRGATLNQGTLNADGSYTMTLAQLSGLKLTPTAGFTGVLALIVTAADMEPTTETTKTTAPMTLNITVEPPTLSINTIDGDGFIDGANVTGGITISGSSNGVLGTGAFAGQTVTVTLNGRSYTGVIGATGSWSVTVGASNLGALTDGVTYVISASATDLAGTAASTTVSAVVDERASLTISPIDGNNFVNSANKAAGITISGTVSDSILANVVGKTVTVTLNGQIYTGAVQASGAWSVGVGKAALAALSDATAIRSRPASPTRPETTGPPSAR